MKKTLKILIFCIIALFVFGITEVMAGSATISANTTTATVGDNVTITVKIYAAAWNVKVSGSGISDTIAGYDEDANNTTKTKTYTINTSTVGTYTVKISGDVTDQNDSKTNVNDSVTVTVKAAEPKPETPTTTPSTNTQTTKPSTNTTTPTQTKSSNSKLSSLKITEGVISPEFNSSVKEYKINIPNEVTKLSIETVTDDSKATVRIRGNDDLKVGENNIEIIVTAEDGTTTTYKLLATRAEEDLTLQALSIYYIDENGEKVDLPLEPQFSFDKYDYKLSKLSYKVKSLIVEATANKEKAQIDITGNEKIKEGKNTITVKVTFEKEEGLQEEKTYTITTEREAEPVVVPPTTMDKIKGFFTGIGNWATKNYERILTGFLLIATTSFAGLTIYFIYDYKNYQKLLRKLAELNKENLMEKANIALNPEMANIENVQNVEDNSEIESTNEIEKIEEKEEAKIGRKGRRFK